MTQLTATYDATEFGWKTEIVNLTGDIYLVVQLDTMGYIVVKQLDEGTEAYPKVLVTSRCLDANIRITGGNGRKIIILTSEQPNKLEYGNI